MMRKDFCNNIGHLLPHAPQQITSTFDGRACAGPMTLTTLLKKKDRLVKTPEQRKNSCRFGIHMGNPGLSEEVRPTHHLVGVCGIVCVAHTQMSIASA
jgi:hypothetical protein